MLLRRRYLSFERSHSKREDMEVIEVKDYIANPKRNGYKSLHMIIKYPLSLNSGTKCICRNSVTYTGNGLLGKFRTQTLL